VVRYAVLRCCVPKSRRYSTMYTGRGHGVPRWARDTPAGTWGPAHGDLTLIHDDCCFLA
jgi:hypothetical protein